MDLRGRCQQIFTVLRERGSPSIRKLAQATGLPKSSVHRYCKGLRERARQVPEAELWEQERGAQWLRVLVVAVLLVFGLKGGVGVERISEFFHRVRLERYLAVSPSALRALRTQMEEVILAYSAEQEQRLGQAGRRLEIIAGADETFFDQKVVLVMMDLVSGYLVLEETADNRTYATWQERVQAAMTRVGLELKYLVSDRAKALIKLALHGLGCPSVPDLFHALRDLAKVLGVSLGLKLAQVEEKLTQARQQLGVLEAKGHDPHVQRRWLAHLNAQAEVLRADQATYQSTLHQASQAVHPFTLADSKAQSSAQVESRLHQAVATLNTLHASHTARDHPAAVRKFQRQIPGLAAPVDAWWLGVEHRLAPLALDEPTQSWFQQLLPVVYWQTQVEKTKTPALKTAYQQAFRQAQAALLQHPLTATVTPPALETYHAWARDLAGQFQRASSAVEGRNGYLSQLHHCARGIPTQRLKVMTVIHNFDLKRADGTTAAERLFRTSFPDLFDWIVVRMAPLPVPRKPRPPAKFNPLKLLTVPA
jgi:hypothetical protein